MPSLPPREGRILLPRDQDSWNQEGRSDLLTPGLPSIHSTPPAAWPQASPSPSLNLELLLSKQVLLTLFRIIGKVSEATLLQSLGQKNRQTRTGWPGASCVVPD